MMPSAIPLKRKKICIIATVPYALLVFMKPHILMLAERYEVTLIANGRKEDVLPLMGEHVKFVSVPIRRDVSLWDDLLALWRLYWIFVRFDFDVVHSLMPKTALLGMVASFIARVPFRIHTFTGQVWANKRGAGRWFLSALDKVVAGCATHLLTDSLSQRQFLISENVVKEGKVSVLGHGSVCGVDVDRFRPDLEKRKLIRSELQIQEDDVVYLFLGRLNRDKGVLDLVRAFQGLSHRMPNAYLLVVGPDEGGIDSEIDSIVGNNCLKFRRVGYTDRPDYYMVASDIFCLPSYREGFGSVIVEAAAVGLPAVASKIYGLVDAVVDGDTGILISAGNVDELEGAMFRLGNDSALSQKMSRNAMARVHDFFTADVVVSEMKKYYATILGA